MNVRPREEAAVQCDQFDLQIGGSFLTKLCQNTLLGIRIPIPASIPKLTSHTILSRQRRPT
jgi:hypothetical protein